MNRWSQVQVFQLPIYKTPQKRALPMEIKPGAYPSATPVPSAPPAPAVPVAAVVPKAAPAHPKAEMAGSWKTTWLESAMMLVHDDKR